VTAADSTLAQGQPRRGSAATRLAGLAGIVGGSVLLAAFVVEIPPGLNDVRLVLFFVGAMAVAAATYTPLSATGRGVARAAVGLVLVANAWGLAMSTISAVLSIPVGPGTFGLVYLWAGLAWWLADALFGFVSLRLGGWARLGGLALGVGSLLAITGMDRLELTSRDNPTIFGPLALTGIAMNGVGWIVLGLWLVTRRPPADSLPEASPRPAATSS
jgi:hypothetical protein